MLTGAQLEVDEERSSMRLVSPLFSLVNRWNSFTQEQAECTIRKKSFKNHMEKRGVEEMDFFVDKLGPRIL